MRSDKEAEERMIDQMTMREGEKQQKIADARRRQEEEAKINLMREVYESRATHVEHMKRMIGNDKDMVR